MQRGKRKSKENQGRQGREEERIWWQFILAKERKKERERERETGRLAEVHMKWKLMQVSKVHQTLFASGDKNKMDSHVGHCVQPVKSDWTHLSIDNLVRIPLVSVGQVRWIFVAFIGLCFCQLLHMPSVIVGRHLTAHHKVTSSRQCNCDCDSC